MNKTELKNKCKEILHKYPVNVKIDKTDFDFLINIFSNHTDWILKKGCGVKDIVTKNTLYGNKCFYLIRIDNTETDISYITSITPNKKLDDIKKACRNSVFEIISEFKSKNVIFGKTLCKLSNVVLTKENCHIDHYNLTFAEVLELWLKNKNIDELYNFVNKSKDNELETYFTDEKIKQDFINFHNNNTNLRAVTKEVNLSLVKK